jgi:DNA-binding GntR family transcriptional regulator
MTKTPISRGVLSDQIKDHLLQEIMAGHFPPGSRIIETRVARELGTSQAPVREALRDLEALGVVEINAFRGARVRHPTKVELLEAYGVRAELESLGARLALERISDADLEELQGYVDEMRLAAETVDTHREAMADVRFHARVIEIGGNHTLERVWRYLEPGSRTYITLVIPGVNQLQIADLHVPILEALKARDPERATAAYHEHFRAVRELLRGRWVDDDLAEPGPLRATAATRPSDTSEPGKVESATKPVALPGRGRAQPRDAKLRQSAARQRG